MCLSIPGFDSTTLVGLTASVTTCTSLTICFFFSFSFPSLDFSVTFTVLEGLIGSAGFEVAEVCIIVFSILSFLTSGEAGDLKRKKLN